MIRPAYETEPVFCVTSDVDWASEDALKIQQDILDKHDVHCTYFMTHNSELLTRLEAEGRVTFAIHPNFLPGSSHGESVDEVIDTVFSFAPKARCFRSHRYFDTTTVAHTMVKRGILYDSNLCTDLQERLMPIQHESGLIRFPCYYEDGTHFHRDRGWDFKAFEQRFLGPGLKIIALHPMVTAFNLTSPEYSAQLKQKFPPEKWIRLSKQELESHAVPGPGPRQFLDDMLAFIKAQGCTVMTMEELYQNFGEPLRQSWT